jgi:hypothetical protein
MMTNFNGWGYNINNTTNQFIFYNEKLKYALNGIDLSTQQVLGTNFNFLYNIPTSLTISDGRRYHLLSPSSISSGIITFSSSNTAVASFASPSIGNILINSGGTTSITVSQAASSTAIATSKSFTLTVVLPSPTITFANISKTYYDISFAFDPLVNPTSNSSGAFTYTSGNTSVATITGNVVSITGIGNSIIRVDQASTSAFTSGNTTAILTVSKSTPAITNFPSTTSVNYGSTFTYTPTSTSNGTISYQSSNASVATVNSSGVISPIGVGNTTIKFIQAAATYYNDISANSVLTVNKGNPVVSLSDISKTFGNPNFQINATSTSSGAYTYTSGNLFVANIISGNTVKIEGVGNTTISVSQASTALYNSATAVANITVAKANPAINFSNISKTYGDSIFRLAPTSNSSGTFSFSSPDTSVVQITDASASIVGIGNATITAYQSESNNYYSGNVAATLVVSKATPTLGNFTISSKNYGDSSFTLPTPTSTNSETGGTFSYVTGNVSVATIFGNIVTIVNAGNTVITATQAQTANYGPKDISASLYVAKINPSITFSPISKTYGDPIFRIDPTTNPTSNSSGTFSFSSSNTNIVRITDLSATIVGAGSATITASQAASNNYNSKNATALFTAAKANPVLSGFSISTQTYGNPSFSLTPPNSTNTDNGAFSYVSENPSIASIIDDVVSINGVGNVVITATQASTNNFNSQNISTTLEVTKAMPNISGFELSNKIYSADSFVLSSPTSESTGVFTYTSSNTNVATIIDNIVTIQGAGTVVITATQASDTNYLQNSISTTLVVEQGSPVITFPPINKQYGNPDFTPTIQSSSTGAFSYSSSNTNIATINPTSGVINIIAVGNTTITATQTSDNNYVSRVSTTTLTVSKGIPNMSNFPNITKKPSDIPFELTPPTTNSAGQIHYSVANSKVAEVNGSLVTILDSGITLITAVQDATENYEQGTISASLKVDNREQLIPNSPTPRTVAGPLVRSQNRSHVRISSKMAMRSKKNSYSVFYFH